MKVAVVDEPAGLVDDEEGEDDPFFGSKSHVSFGGENGQVKDQTFCIHF